MIDETHDSSARSFLETDDRSDFPIQNLPLGVFRRRDEIGHGHIATRIGDQIFDLSAARRTGLLADADGAIADACGETGLNRLMSLGRAASRSLRRTIFQLVKAGSAHEEAVRRCLFPVDEAEMLLPAQIGDYTDFYASVNHATNVGSMFRPDNPLLPNYKWVPIGYHGRASSIIVSGTPVRRPFGQTKDEKAAGPEFGPTKRLDFELEVGAFIGKENALGTTIAIDEAEEHLFGLCLVNDWSARDIQAWEYQPLGPFLAKNFATTISPWIVTADALEPFRSPAASRAEGDPQPLPYLAAADGRGFDLALEVWIRTSRMREAGLAAARLSSTDFQKMYWTFAQMIAHHASNGCNLRSGDLIASGTVSGEKREERGSLLELAWRGSEPVELPNGEIRRFLEDGDEIILQGRCSREGFAPIGFGECRGRIANDS
jgi:fumarylacetoacetase